MERKAKEEKAKLQEQLGTIEAAIKARLREEKQDSAATPSGIATLVRKEKLRLEDWEAFWEVAKDQPELLKHDINRTEINSRISHGEELPPGVKVEAFIDLSITKPRARKR